jgi:hypothetical protein
LESPQNSVDHTVGVGEDVAVPETDYMPAVTFELRASVRICSIVGVLTAIQFDHQPVFCAREVDDIVSDRMLAAKFVPHHAAIAESRPHTPLGIGRGLSELAGRLIGHRRKLGALGK